MRIQLPQLHWSPASFYLMVGSVMMLTAMALPWYRSAELTDINLPSYSTNAQISAMPQSDTILSLYPVFGYTLFAIAAVMFAATYWSMAGHTHLGKIPLQRLMTRLAWLALYTSLLAIGVLVTNTGEDVTASLTYGALPACIGSMGLIIGSSLLRRQQASTIETTKHNVGTSSDEPQQLSFTS